MKKQHHYKTEQEILDKIDAKRKRAIELNASAETLETLASESFKLDEIGAGREYKEQSRKARKQAKRIEEVVLPALGETLSAFRTAPMIPVCGNDHSVASLV